MSTPLPTDPQPSFGVTTPIPSQIQRIAALADPVVRNLQITQTYFELSQAMAALTGHQAN